MRTSARWLSAWLNWLDEVQQLSGRSHFAEDPRLERLGAWHLNGVPASEAVARLERLQSTPARQC